MRESATGPVFAQRAHSLLFAPLLLSACPRASDERVEPPGEAIADATPEPASPPSDPAIVEAPPLPYPHLGIWQSQTHSLSIARFPAFSRLIVHAGPAESFDPPHTRPVCIVEARIAAGAATACEVPLRDCTLPLVFEVREGAVELSLDGAPRGSECPENPEEWSGSYTHQDFGTVVARAFLATRSQDEEDELAPRAFDEQLIERAQLLLATSEERGSFGEVYSAHLSLEIARRQLFRACGGPSELEACGVATIDYTLAEELVLYAPTFFDRTPQDYIPQAPDLEHPAGLWMGSGAPEGEASGVLRLTPLDTERSAADETRWKVEFQTDHELVVDWPTVACEARGALGEVLDCGACGRRIRVWVEGEFLRVKAIGEGWLEPRCDGKQLHSYPSEAWELYFLAAGDPLALVAHPYYHLRGDEADASKKIDAGYELLGTRKKDALLVIAAGTLAAFRRAGHDPNSLTPKLAIQLLRFAHEALVESCSSGLPGASYHSQLSACSALEAQPGYEAAVRRFAHKHRRLFPGSE
ncbi:hypothetical protein [Enhygromyxa salina]|nr:hypothetical protein [Enhygromyxa salina]